MKGNQRLVIDTNVWISYLIGKNTQQLEKIIIAEELYFRITMDKANYLELENQKDILIIYWSTRSEKCDCNKS